MNKFPADVITAERKTNGDPNIIENPIFSPDEKPDYSAIFGTPKLRKSKKSPSCSFAGASSACSTPNKTISCLNNSSFSDRGIRILEQTPQIKEETLYKCECNFETQSMTVFTIHTKSHKAGVHQIPTEYYTLSKKGGTKRKRVRITTSNTYNLEELKNHANKINESIDSDEPLRKKPKKHGTHKSKRLNISKPTDKEDKEDIRKDLLAEWNDDSDAETELSSNLDRTVETSTTSTTDNTPKKGELQIVNDIEQKLIELDLKVPEPNKSCFDFEEEDDEGEYLTTSAGRKIPRVIPLTDWQKRLEADDSDEDLENLLENGSSKQSENSEAGKETNNDDPYAKAFKNLLESTTVPQLPKLPMSAPTTILSSEVNSHINDLTINKEHVSPSVCEINNETLLKSSTVEEGFNSTQLLNKSQDTEDACLVKHIINICKNDNKSLIHEENICESDECLDKNEESRNIPNDDLSKHETSASITYNHNTNLSSHNESPKLPEDPSNFCLDKNEDIKSFGHDISMSNVDVDENMDASLGHESKNSLCDEQDNVLVSSNTTNTLDVPLIESEHCSEIVENENLNVPNVNSNENEEPISIEKSTYVTSDPCLNERESTISKDSESLGNADGFSELVDHHADLENNICLQKEVSVIHPIDQNKKLVQDNIITPKDGLSELDQYEGNHTAPLDSNEDLKSSNNDNELLKLNLEADLGSTPKPEFIESENCSIEKSECLVVDQKESVCIDIVHHDSEPHKETKHIVPDEEIEKTKEIILSMETFPMEYPSILTKDCPTTLETETKEKFLDNSMEGVEKEESLSDLDNKIESETNELVHLFEEPLLDIKIEYSSKIEIDQGHTENIQNSSTPEVQVPLLRQDSREIIDDSRPINPKKRFVKTFEHFEQQQKLNDSALEGSTIQVASPQNHNTDLEYEKKLKKISKPKSFRDLILERQREEEEESRFNQTNLDLNLRELPSKILVSPLHEDLDTFDDGGGFILNEKTDSALNLILPSHQETIDLKTDCDLSTVPEALIKTVECHKQSPSSENQFYHTATDPQPHNTSKSYTKDITEVPEDLSALSTLAAVSEYTTRSPDSSKLLMDLEDNRNINETDLVDTQNEIANIPLPPDKPISLSNFSVDFPEEQDNTHNFENKLKSKAEEPDLIERSLGKVFADEFGAESEHSNLSHDDVEHILSSKVSNSPVKKHFKLVEQPEYSSSSKLLEILSDVKPKAELPKDESHQPLQSPDNVMETVTKTKLESVSSSDLPKINIDSMESTALKPRKTLPKFESKHTKFIIKTGTLSKVPPTDIKTEIKTSTDKECPIIETKSNKPSVSGETKKTKEKVSVQKVSAQDHGDVDAFIIHKVTEPTTPVEEPKKLATVGTFGKKVVRTTLPLHGKAKILHQTIIKPASDSWQPTIHNMPKTSSVDDHNEFDINSMPIVLSDQILTPENIENMPVVLTEPVKSNVIRTVGKTNTAAVESKAIVNKQMKPHSMLLKSNPTPQKIIKDIKTVPSLKLPVKKPQSSIISRPSTSEKFIIVPSGSTSGTKTPIKRTELLKKSPSGLVTPSSTSMKPASTLFEPSGNKIMIVTNQQGQQSRVILTPDQQKMIGYRSIGNKLIKSTLKGSMLQKTSVAATTTATTTGTGKTSNMKSQIVTQTISSQSELLNQARIATERKLLAARIDPSKSQRKLQIHPQKTSTVNMQSLTRPVFNKDPIQGVKKVQGLDDALLEKQVQEQVNAIKASGSFAAMQASVSKSRPVKRTYSKKILTPSGITQKVALTKTQLLGTSSPLKLAKPDSPTMLPSLSPISPKKSSTSSPSKPLNAQSLKRDSTKTEIATLPQKPVNQLTVCDPDGNRTTVTEGQIIAVPTGEAVDGETQSYMLLTFDETGKLTPLNNEAVLSLNSNLCLGGDLANVVLPDSSLLNQIVGNPESNSSETVVLTSSANTTTSTAQTIQTVCNITGGDSTSNQQLIITGDPVSTQKFLDSLSEGNQDLANLLATAEGNILIQTDDQHILINTDGNSQLAVLDSEPTRVVGGRPLFTNQTNKSQDILAAALANTDVFQQETHLPSNKLSPNTTYSKLTKVSETTLSLSSPIMTPLEIPTTNKKKIPDDETDTLTTEVAKNVDLPITVTDPTIAQTVSQQLMATNNNLDMPLSISDPGGVPLSSTEMNSPSFLYPLSTLEESEPKQFSGPISMPLLNEDSQTDSNGKIQDHDLTKSKNVYFQKRSESSFLSTLDSSNRDVLLGEDLCSLNEPPTDMFELAVLPTDYREGAANELQPEVLKESSSYNYSGTPTYTSIQTTSSLLTGIDESLTEMSVQPSTSGDISAPSCKNTALAECKKRSSDDNSDSDRKKIKFD